MAQRKYFTEFALNMQATAYVLLQQESLGNIAQSTPNQQFHIYMITRRPRVAFKPDSLRFTASTVSGVFTIQKGPALAEHAFSVPNNLGTDKIRVDCPWPHTEFKFVDNYEKVISNGKVALLMAKISPDFWELLDLEVLYVGQSFGLAGERTAEERLASHSTLQNIYAEAQRRSPDQEIWVVLMAFTNLLITSMGGIETDLESNDLDDRAHVRQVLSTPISESQQINFTEAALIRYFQPEYNTLLRNSFPNPAHKTYSQCYELDINSVAFELATEGFHSRLWSGVVKPQWYHLMTYPLHNAKERRGLFEFDGAVPEK